MVALGLHALQHRGQEGCGIVSYDGKNYHSEKRQGLVGDHITDPKVLEKQPGNFDNGQINGEGVAIYPNGDQYEGFFKNGKREGSGKITYKNGVTYEGQWENNNRVSD